MHLAVSSRKSCQRSAAGRASKARTAAAPPPARPGRSLDQEIHRSAGYRGPGTFPAGGLQNGLSIEADRLPPGQSQPQRVRLLPGLDDALIIGQLPDPPGIDHSPAGKPHQHQLLPGELFFPDQGINGAQLAASERHPQHGLLRLLFQPRVRGEDRRQEGGRVGGRITAPDQLLRRRRLTGARRGDEAGRSGQRQRALPGAEENLDSALPQELDGQVPQAALHCVHGFRRTP
jgi:hypothetical protein